VRDVWTTPFICFAPFLSVKFVWKQKLESGWWLLLEPPL
jgi:hypothetical protein